MSEVVDTQGIRQDCVRIQKLVKGENQNVIVSLAGLIWSLSEIIDQQQKEIDDLRKLADRGEGE